MEENKEILELLRQIEKSSRQRVRMSRILCALALAAVIAWHIFLGKPGGRDRPEEKEAEEHGPSER